MLVLISATAGYGKSILAAQWCTLEPERPSMWVRLSEADNDPVLLLQRLMEGLERLPRPDGAQPGRPAERPGPIGLDAGTIALRQAVTERPPFLMVLDDLHEVTNVDSLHLVSAVVDAMQ